jgi:hypothetical protein
MSEADDVLKALFALDQPPAHDPIFVLETTRRIQQRRFWMALFAGVPWVIAASAILWLATPWLEAVSRPAAALMAALIPVAALALGAVFLATPRLNAL